MVPARHLVAPGPAPTGPSVRVTVIASAAAVGTVATGAFTALLPTAGAGIAASASADEAWSGTLAAGGARLRIPADATAIGALTPVSFTAGGPVTSATTTTAGFAASDQHLALLGKATDIAAKIAKVHAEEARIDAVVATGGVDGWIAEALQIMDLPQTMAPGVRRIVMSESGGNPHARNNWDANARRGTPSQGLMQTIPVTFRHYVAPQLADRPITDPVANLTAGLRYMIDNYGAGTVTAGGRANSSGGYVGY